MNGDATEYGNVNDFIRCDICHMVASEEEKPRIVARGCCENCDGVEEFIDKYVRAYYKDVNVYKVKAFADNLILGKEQKNENMKDILEYYFCHMCGQQLSQGIDMLKHVREHCMNGN